MNYLKSNAQKQMAKSSLGHKFHNLECFELGIYFIFLDFSVNLRHHKNVKFINFDVKLFYPNNL